MSTTACRLARWMPALGLAWLVMAAAVAAAPSEAQPAEPKAAQAAPPAAAAPESKPAEATPAEAKPAEPPRAPARRILTPEEIKELPVFSRYDAATWDKMLQKGNALLEDVKDNTFGYDEEAFYWLVYHVVKLKPELMKPDAEAIEYTRLYAETTSYRGMPVTIRGYYIEVSQWQPPVLALRKDVPYLYECSVRPLPVGREIPPIVTVIVSENPMLYLHKDDEVRVKGYFYKIRTFMAREGGFKVNAPMLIAQRLEPEEGPAPGSGLTGESGRPGGGAFPDPYLVMMIAVVIILMIAFVAVRMQLRKPKPHAPRERPNQVHRFRLRRPDRVEPPGPGGGGSEGGGPKP